VINFTSPTMKRLNSIAEWPKTKAIGLTAIASLIIWCATYSALLIMVGPQADRPGDLLDVTIHSILLFVVGWLVAGLVFLASGCSIRAPSAARVAIGASLVFAIMIGTGTYMQVKERARDRIQQSICDNRLEPVLGC
jgi:hypothetical protein